MNQELEQYLQFFIENRQKDWPEWLAAAEFTVNNKVHTATKVSPFMANYEKKLRMEGNIWERRENLKNAKELIEEFEQGRIKVKRQEGEVNEYKRIELLGKYTAKVLYRWDDQKFEEEYLKKLEKNWKKWKEDRQIDESEHLKMIEEEKMEEENEKIRRRDWGTGHFSRGEILRGG